MRRFSNIDNVFMLKHELTLQEIYVLEWILHLPIWADKTILQDKTIYFASKNKACQDLPMITKQNDTMQRYYRRLEKKGMINLFKVSNKDYVEILPKCHEWNSVIKTTDRADVYDEVDGNNTSNRPTNSNTNPYSNLNSIKPAHDLFGDEILDPKKKTLFKNCIYSDLAKFTLKMKEAESLGIDIGHYHRGMDRWSRTKTVKRTADGWIATAETWMEKDKNKGKLVMIKTDDQVEQDDADAVEYLSTN